MDIKWIRLGALLGFIASFLIILLGINFTPDYVARNLSPDGILHPKTIVSISIIRLWVITISVLGLSFTLLFLIKPYFLNFLINKLANGKQEGTRLYIILAFILTFINLLPIWLVDFPPLQDYPFHLLEAHIITNYWNPNFNYPETFTLSFFPTPYILMYYMFIVLSHAFSIQVAGKIILSLYVILLPLSTFYLIYAVDKTKIIIGFFSFLFIYNYFFNMGFINFSLSIPFFLFALGYWFKTKDYANWTHRTILSILILFVYMAHYFAYCLLFVMIIILSIYVLRKPKSIIANLVVFLPSLILLIISLLRDFVPPSSDFISLSPDLPIAEANDFILACYGDIIDKIKNVIFFKKQAFYFMSFDPKLEKIILVLISCLAIWLLILQFRNRNDRLMTSKFLMLLLMFALYLALPTHLIRPSLWIIDTRILIFIIFIGLLLLEAPKNKLLRNIVMFVILSLSLAHLHVIFVNYRLINQDLKEFHAATKKIPSGKRVLFRTERSISRHGLIDPFRHFGAYYYLEKRAGDVPDLNYYIGPIRPLKYKNKQMQAKFKVVEYRKPYIKPQISLFRPSYFILFAKEKDKWLEELIEEYGYFRVVKIKDFKVYKIEKARKQKIPTLSRKYDKFGFRKYDYLFLYNDGTSTNGLTNNLDLEFSRRDIRIYKRK